MRKFWPLAAMFLVTVVGLMAWLRWPAEPAPKPSPPPFAQLEPTQSSASAADAAPTVRYPVEAVVEADTTTSLDPAAVLRQLFGRSTVLSMLRVDEFPRRFVATTINLASPRSTPRLWPVVQPPGRFTARQREGATTISLDNGLRYSAFVQLIETVDAERAVDAYRRLYPQLQHAYEELGYPGRYFNDQLVSTIDLLLTTPDLDEPARVHLPSGYATARPRRPWVLYEFDDPALESLASGQKILMRMGPFNERRMKHRLREVRALLTAAKTGG